MGLDGISKGVIDSLTDQEEAKPGSHQCLEIWEIKTSKGY